MAQNRIYKRELPGGGVRWDVTIDLRDPATNKRIQRRKTFRTRKEAQAWLAEQRVAVANGTLVDRSTKTVRELMEFWLDHYARHQVSTRTFDGYAATIRNHIVPKLGHIQIQKLTAARLQQFCTEKINEGCGPRTVELCHLNISQALDQAVALGWVPRNVADVVKPPRWKPKEMETWSAEEATRFLAVAHESTYGPIWLLALTKGLRKGELLGLRWQDVDLERGVLRIRQTVGPVRGRIEIKPPKTPKSRREVDLRDGVLAALREHKRRQNERRLVLGALWQDHDLVFANAIGGPIHPDNVDRDYDRLVKKAGIKRIRIHDLRHSYATLALATGEHIKVVSETLGHADVATTLRIYAHVMPAQRVALADKMEALLLGTSAAGQSG